MDPGAEEETLRKYKWTHTDEIWAPEGQEERRSLCGSPAPSMGAAVKICILHPRTT